MNPKKILVDDTNRELSIHGTKQFPMTVHHDDLWAYEGRSIPIHWHPELEISLPRKGEALYQVYQKRYLIQPGEGLLLNTNVPHSFCSPNNDRAWYSTFLVRPDFLYGDFGSEVKISFAPNIIDRMPWSKKSKSRCKIYETNRRFS